MTMVKSRSAFRTLTSAVLVASSRCLSSSSTTMKVAVPSQNLEAIADLEPKSLWSQFATISSIPRPSKQEDAVLDYIKSFAEERNLKWKEDAVGNLAVFRPGSGAGKDAPPVILQGHVDMVTEKNSDTAHDFEKDPILLRRFKEGKENWLGAEGTTLGADNGIGVAAALALLDEGDDVSLPPLEALFTIDEETGLTGATQLNAQELGLTGKTMLNLDTEEWGELYVGCAGGGESTITVPCDRNANGITSSDSVEFVEIRVEGLMGGHSGINIHEGRANAILLCAETAQKALESFPGMGLVSLTGGDKHNAIPREARAVFAVSGEDGRAAIVEAVKQCTVAAKAEFGILESNLSISVVDSTSDTPKKAPMNKESATNLLSLLLALPHGPIKFSHAMPDLVETSNNVASIAMGDDDGAVILCSTRSSIASALESARNRISAIASLAGASIEKSEAYPGWNPNMESPLLQLGQKILTPRLNKSPGVKAIHAGLECGLLIEKMGGDVDALSFGPTIMGAHSPDERIHTDTVPPFYDLVQDILKELAAEKKA